MQRMVHSAVGSKTLADTIFRASFTVTLTHVIIQQNIDRSLLIAIPNLQILTYETS
jgi:hypothetical protein